MTGAKRIIRRSNGFLAENPAGSALNKCRTVIRTVRMERYLALLDTDVLERRFARWFANRLHILELIKFYIGGAHLWRINSYLLLKRIWKK